MSFIRYKKFGNIEYAYEITAYWDRKEKKSRQHSKYLGIVVDKEAKIFKKKEKKQHEEEKLILDFGDTYILNEFMKKTKIRDLLFKVFGEMTEYLLALIYYRLCYPSAMMYAKTWYQGSYARIISRDIDLSSQRISDFLKAIGEEHLQREYFKNHISLLAKTNEGIIIDATSMPNQIHFPFNIWGYNDGGIDKQIRFLFVIDKKSSLPLYFRYLPGNIVDVSSLTTTIEELNKYDIKSSFALVDAGFYSEDNVKKLYSDKIDFLTRLPAKRTLYKDLIKEAMPDIEAFKNAVKYGDRILFVKQKKSIFLATKDMPILFLIQKEKGGKRKSF